MSDRVPPGWRLREYESVASTSDLCATLAQAGEPARLAVLAARQTAGRGSRGRQWETLSGNLALSVLLRPPGPPASAGHWALLAAVAMAEALEANGSPPIRLKWPNDLLLDGRKLGGLLLDSAVEVKRLAWLVIGFGVNLGSAPDLPGAAKLPRPAPPRPVALSVMHCLDQWTLLSLRDGFAPVRRAWLERGPAPGTQIRLNLGATQVSGTFAGLSEAGELLLQSNGRVRAFPTGDVLQGV